MSVSLSHLSQQLAVTNRLVRAEIGGSQDDSGDSFATQPQGGGSSTPPVDVGGAGMFASGFLAALSMLGSGTSASPASTTSDTSAPSLSTGLSSVSVEGNAQTTTSSPSLASLVQALDSLVTELQGEEQGSAGSSFQTTSAPVQQRASTTAGTSGTSTIATNATSSSISRAAGVTSSTTPTSSSLGSTALASETTSDLDTSLLASM